MVQNFSDNLYLIDLSYLNTPSEVVYDLSTILDNDLAKNQRVKLKLGKVDFNKSQLLCIKSLIESINSTLAIVEGESDITRNSAISCGLVFQNSVDNIKEIMFFNQENSEQPQETSYQEVKPDLFPEVSPVRQEEQQQEEKAADSDNTEENKEDNSPQLDTNYSQPIVSSGESYEIQPQKFETSEENLNFEKDNQTWLETEEEKKVQSLEKENNNWVKLSENNNEEQTEDNQNVLEKVNSLFDSENNQENRLEELPQNQEEQAPAEAETKQEEDTSAPGIQTLADIPLDIPTDETIREELDVIYSAERKLDDLFAATGMKEEKFQSIKEMPKAEEKEYTQYDFELEALPTKYLKQTICTGQYISFDGNLVIIGDCHEGSEISATGDITVWGELSGSVHAGNNGNEKAKIRALKMNPSQIRISNSYVKRPSVLNDSSKVDAVPEEAMILNGEIAVYKIYK
ncbi:MAG: hypothetical protein K6C94_07970 [Candidatus Gastranaerophilales bacterium]|nr:hypothetical protein [Candidatus Gastranaerophilales bacterium]